MESLMTKRPFTVTVYVGLSCIVQVRLTLQL